VGVVAGVEEGNLVVALRSSPALRLRSGQSGAHLSDDEAVAKMGTRLGVHPPCLCGGLLWAFHIFAFTVTCVSLTLGNMDYSRIITMEPGKRSGKPCIRGLRITVSDVLGYLASGITHEEVLRDFPYLTESDIRACLAFAADRERKLETMVA
jgi:uncharacterized protein (DUF433 family)